jgi:hypothetical protein
MFHERGESSAAESAYRRTITGYVTALHHGTSYRVLHAHDQAGHVLQATGTMDAWPTATTSAPYCWPSWLFSLRTHHHEPGFRS